MPWTNYHSHTHFCDGSDTPELYVKNAISEGMKAYGFSSHAPVPFKTDWNINSAELHEYLDQVSILKDKYSDKIETYIGLEVDYIPGVTGRFKHILEKTDLDYFIGSIHFVDAFADNLPWNIDHNKEEFEKGITNIYNGNFKVASDRFYALTQQMLLEDKPDIVGHLDKIKMFNTDNCYFSKRESWYVDQVRATLDVVKKTGVIIEINTRGYYRYKQRDLYPSLWIIEECNKRGIPLMLNSDCHQPDEICKGFSYAVELLKKVGVKKLWAMIDSKWQDFEYSAEGLIL